MHSFALVGLLDGSFRQSSKNAARNGFLCKMRFRFFRRIPLIPGFLWLNLSKCGFSFSVGKRGWRLTRNRHGVLFTLGLTGTGMFWSKFFSKNSQDKKLGSEPQLESITPQKKSIFNGNETR